MNTEHLELYHKLSETKIYKDRFIDWRKGDKHICPLLYMINGQTAVVYQDEWGDLVKPDHPPDENCIWLPPVFDPETPERCLTGMLNGEWAISNPRDDGTWQVCIFQEIEEVVETEDTVEIADSFDGDSLDMVLIRAILKQEER